MDLQTYQSFTIEPNVGSLSVVAVNDNWEIESGSSVLVAAHTATAQDTATHHTISNSSAQAARLGRQRSSGVPLYECLPGYCFLLDHVRTSREVFRFEH